MAHYAKVNNNIVEQVIVAEASFFDDFVDNTPGEWIQTSYNTHGGAHLEGGTPLRKNFAGVGDVYDPIKDAFYTHQPFDSWTLNETTCVWEAPVVYPDDGKFYEWNEGTQAWVEFTPIGE